MCLDANLAEEVRKEVDTFEVSAHSKNLYAAVRVGMAASTYIRKGTFDGFSVLADHSSELSVLADHTSELKVANECACRSSEHEHSRDCKRIIHCWCSLGES